MPILALPDFAAALPAGPLIGLDPGAKRIGVAVSDTTRVIASALIVIARKKFAEDAARIFEAYDARGCVGLVVGLPLNMDGASGPAAQSARAFARNLIAVRDVPLLLQDERLSTSEAARTLIAADASRARRAEVVDKVAAAITLQSALDALKARAS
ncbi:MAG: Holliday junction resolvase RuvX [Alphaproteobacteria bacterium]|nr:Holliday junction resolvase RuvX [Alphaproteobacteria bacterium]